MAGRATAKFGVPPSGGSRIADVRLTSGVAFIECPSMHRTASISFSVALMAFILAVTPDASAAATVAGPPPGWESKLQLVPADANPAADAGSPRETVLFPFDDYSLPFNKGLILTLMPGRKSAKKADLGIDPKHPGKPVLPIGKPGDPDEKRVYFFGTVIKVGDEYRMWYSGHDGHKRQVCYAVSKDGIAWQKPKLGLVDYQGGRQNNLVLLDDHEAMPGMSALVLHDQEDHDPARRFKMIREASASDLRAAVSADGIHWRSISGNKDILKNTAMEPSGFIKFNGAYYLNGHGGPIPHPIPTHGYLRPQK